MYSTVLNGYGCHFDTFPVSASFLNDKYTQILNLISPIDFGFKSYINILQATLINGSTCAYRLYMCSIFITIDNEFDEILFSAASAESGVGECDLVTNMSDLTQEQLVYLMFCKRRRYINNCHCQVSNRKFPIRDMNVVAL